METIIEPIKAALPELATALGMALATTIVVLIRQLTIWVKEYIALQRLHIGAETFVKSAILQNPDTDLQPLLTDGEEFLRRRFPDSVKQVRATPDKLITILQSKAVDYAQLAKKVAVDRPA